MAKVDRTPKKIAGLKLPKSIRQAPAIKALLATPAGRKLLGDALMEGAAFAAAKVMEAHSAGQATATVKSAKTASKPKRPASAKPVPAKPEAPVASEISTPEVLSPEVSSAPIVSVPKAVAPAAIAAAPPKPPAATPEPFKNDVPVTAKPPVQLLDNKVEDDAPPAKSNAAE